MLRWRGSGFGRTDAAEVLLGGTVKNESKIGMIAEIFQTATNWSVYSIFFVFENNDLKGKLPERQYPLPMVIILLWFHLQVGLSLHRETVFYQCRVAAAIL